MPRRETDGLSSPGDEGEAVANARAAEPRSGVAWPPEQSDGLELAAESQVIASHRPLPPSRRILALALCLYDDSDEVPTWRPRRRASESVLPVAVPLHAETGFDQHEPETSVRPRGARAKPRR